MSAYRRAVFAAVLAVLLKGLPLSVQGQATSPNAGAGNRRPRVPVTVVLQDTVAPAPGFRILRRVDQRPLDVIVLSGAADGETLSEAVRNLLMVRQVAGDTAPAAGQVRVRRAAARATQRPYPWAARVVNDLRTAPPQPVAGIGMVRAVEIWFPPQHRRAEGQTRGSDR